MGFGDTGKDRLRVGADRGQPRASREILIVTDSTHIIGGGGAHSLF